MAELMKPDQKMTNLRKFFEDNKGKIASIIPKHFSLDRQGQLLFTAVYRNPDLLDCTPASLVGALIQGGTFGLEPVGPGGYWLVPFWQGARDGRPARRNVTMIIDYRGLMGMARRTKDVRTVDWRPVRAGDKFSYEYGSTAFLKHVPAEEPIHAMSADGKTKTERSITHFYAYGMLASGALVFEVMRREDVEWHRDRYSKAAKAGPWVSNFDEMGAKTCVRKLADKLPFDPFLSQAVVIDNKTEQGVEHDFAALLGDLDDGGGNGGSTGSTKLDRATEEMKARDAQAAGGPASDVGAAEVSNAQAIPTSTPPADLAPPPGGTGGLGGQPAGHPGPVAAPAPGPAPAAAPASSLSAHDRHQRIDRINQCYVDLGLSGPGDIGKRAWLWDRFVGKDVGPEAAPAEKLDALIAELERQKAARKKK